MDTALKEDLIQYVRDLYAAEDEVLQFIREDSAAEGLPQIHINPEDGRLMQILLSTIGAQRVVEIGTLAGYSGVWIARTLPEEGRLITLEKDPEHADFARRSFERAGVADRVEIRLGSALDTLRKLVPEGPFDAVFIDANKDHYPRYLEWSIANIRPGGLIMAHNAFWSGRIIDPTQQDASQVLAIRFFNHQLADHPRLLGMIIPMGDGLAVALRLP